MNERKIIVVDDEEYICQGCREVLDEEGYEVKTFIRPLVVEKTFEHARRHSENKYLREELTKKYEFENLVGESEAIKDIRELIKIVAPTDATVLIHGESGTGNRWSPRPFTAIAGGEIIISSPSIASL